MKYPTIAPLLGFIVHPGLKRFLPPAHSHQVGGELSRGSCGLLSMGLFFGAPRMLLIENLHHSVLISRNGCFHAMLRMSICVILSWNTYIYILISSRFSLVKAIFFSRCICCEWCSTPGMSSTQFWNHQAVFMMLMPCVSEPFWFFSLWCSTTLFHSPESNPYTSDHLQKSAAVFRAISAEKGAVVPYPHNMQTYLPNGTRVGMFWICSFRGTKGMMMMILIQCRQEKPVKMPNVVRYQ